MPVASVSRRSLEEHKSQRCPLRPFTCQYCNHKATHQKVTKEHWPVCEKYPLTCHECGEGEIERQHLKGHLKQTCPLEVIQCDFSYAGCGAQLQRRFMPAHMKQGIKDHLSLLLMGGFVGFRESFLGLVNHHMHWMLADYHPGQVAPDDTSPLLSLLLLLETYNSTTKIKDTGTAQQSNC